MSSSLDNEEPTVAPTTEGEGKEVGTKTEEMKVEGRIETNWTGVVTSFDSMGLNELLLRGIYAYGFEKPSKIQQRGIMPILAGHDTIAQAQSGTGKTATFTIAALQSIDTGVNQCQALILAPTRELAQQTQKVVRALGDFLNISSHACVGGTLVRDDIRTLREGVQVVVGTPGRVTHMIQSDVLNLTPVKLFILDEADEMLSRGFKEQIYEIFQHLSNKVQVCLFSATMPDEILEISQRFMRTPVRILVKKDEVTLEGISISPHTYNTYTQVSFSAQNLQSEKTRHTRLNIMGVMIVQTSQRDMMRERQDVGMEMKNGLSCILKEMKWGVGRRRVSFVPRIPMYSLFQPDQFRDTPVLKTYVYISVLNF